MLDKSCPYLHFFNKGKDLSQKDSDTIVKTKLFSLNQEMQGVHYNTLNSSYINFHLIRKKKKVSFVSEENVCPVPADTLRKRMKLLHKALTAVAAA